MTSIQPWLVPMVVALFASQGFWAWLTNRSNKKAAKLAADTTLESASVRLLLGIAHDRIIFLGMKYIDRGYLTHEEYEDFMHYLWEPYSTFGGNGLAERVVILVKDLPLRGHSTPSVPIPIIEEQYVDRVPHPHPGDIRHQA